MLDIKERQKNKKAVRNSSDVLDMCHQNVVCTWEVDWGVDDDDEQPQDDGDDTQQTSQSAQPSGTVHVPVLKTVPGLGTQKKKWINSKEKKNEHVKKWPN